MVFGRNAASLDHAIRGFRRDQQWPGLRRFEERGDENRHIGAGGIDGRVDVTVTGIDEGRSPRVLDVRAILGRDVHEGPPGRR